MRAELSEASVGVEYKHILLPARRDFMPLNLGMARVTTRSPVRVLRCDEHGAHVERLGSVCWARRRLDRSLVAYACTSTEQTGVGGPVSDAEADVVTTDAGPEAEPGGDAEPRDGAVADAQLDATDAHNLPTYADIGGDTGSDAVNHPQVLVDAVGGKLLVVAASASSMATLRRCNLDGTQCEPLRARPLVSGSLTA